MSEDALNAKKMNVNPGGKQPLMRPGYFVKHGIRFTQHMGNKYQDRHSIINCRNFSSIYRHSTHSCEPNFDRICKPNISSLRPWTSHRSYVKKNGYRVFQKYRKLHILFINFQIFSKKAKQAILLRDFLREKCIDQKN